MVLLGPDAVFALEAIRADLTERWPALGPISEPTAGEHSFAFGAAGLIVGGGRIPRPVPWSDLENPCATSLLWPTAGDVLRGHTEHLLLSVTSSDDPLARMRLLTQVTASALAACPAALGVYWPDAALVIPPAMFLDYATHTLPDGLPVHLWVGFRAGKGATGKTVGFTVGMASLGHREIETENSTDAPGELRQRLYELAKYLLERGPVVTPGQTVGRTAEERIRVSFAPSVFGHPGEVMRLTFDEAPAPKKNRWQQSW
jgi:hypothetical protein